MKAPLFCTYIGLFGLGGIMALAQQDVAKDAASVADKLKVVSSKRLVEPEKVKWTEETNVTVATWQGPTTAKISYCYYSFEYNDSNPDLESVRLLYVPSERYYHLGRRGEFSQNISNCFVFQEGLLIFKLPLFGGVLSTNRIPAGEDPDKFIESLKREFIENYPNVKLEADPHQKVWQRLEKYFGDGRITYDPVTGERKVIERGPMGVFRLGADGVVESPKILSIGTDGTNAVVAYDSIKELSEDRPVLTLDSKFQVVRAEVNGQPIIFNRTNYIYFRE